MSEGKIKTAVVWDKIKNRCCPGRYKAAVDQGGNINIRCLGRNKKQPFSGETGNQLYLGEIKNCGCLGENKETGVVLEDMRKEPLSGEK